MKFLISFGADTGYMFFSHYQFSLPIIPPIYLLLGPPFIVDPIIFIGLPTNGLSKK